AFYDHPIDAALFHRLEVTLQQGDNDLALLDLYNCAIETAHEVIGLEYDLEALYVRRGELEYESLDRLADAAQSYTSALAENPGESRYLELIEAIAEQLEAPDLVTSALEVQVATLSEDDTARAEPLLRLADRATDIGRRQQLLEAALDAAPA